MPKTKKLLECWVNYEMVTSEEKVLAASPQNTKFDMVFDNTLTPNDKSLEVVAKLSDGTETSTKIEFGQKTLLHLEGVKVAMLFRYGTIGPKFKVKVMHQALNRP